MAREKRAAWFKVFLAQKPTIDAADDISVGKALKAALRYFDTGEIAALGPMPRVIFAGLKGSVDEAIADYEASVRNGRAGGAKRWENTPPILPLPPLSPLDTPPVGCDREAEAEADVINSFVPPPAGTKRPKQVFEHDSLPYRAARWLADQIEERLPNCTPHTEATLQNWAADFDKCHRLDKHDWEDINAVLQFSQFDPFWQTNILSGGKFRKQYTQLLAKMGGGGT